MERHKGRDCVPATVRRSRGALSSESLRERKKTGGPG